MYVHTRVWLLTVNFKYTNVDIHINIKNKMNG